MAFDRDINGRSKVGLGITLLFCLVFGCSSKGPTHLFESFDSYQKPEYVRDLLVRTNKKTEWREESKRFSPTPPDVRPPYNFIYMTGPYESWEMPGQLKLTFYNERLMEVQFSTAKGHEYLETLRQHSKVPLGPAQEIVVDRHTRFRFDADPDGTYRFTWYDSNLEGEWRSWTYKFG